MREGRVPEEVARSWSKLAGSDSDGGFEAAVESSLRRKRVEAAAAARWEQESYEPTAWVEPVAYTGRDYLAMDVAEPTYLIDRLWPTGGSVVLVARAKIGKTTLVLNMVGSLLTGSKFLGEFEVNQFEGNICLMDLEVPPAMLRQWMRDVGLDSERLLVMPLRGQGGWLARHLADIDTRSQLATWLREHNIKVLIVDPLSAWLAGAGVEENSNSEVGKLLRGQLAALVEEAGISELMLVHHAGHGADRARGASALVDWPDATWTYSIRDKGRDTDDDMEADELSKPRYLSAVGRDVELPKTRVSFDRATRELTLEDDVALTAELRASRETAKDDELLRVLTEELNGEAESENKWIKAVGGNSGDFRASRKRLLDQGRVVQLPGRRTNSHRFVLTDRHNPEEIEHREGVRPSRLDFVPSDEDEPRTTSSPRPVL